MSLSQCFVIQSIFKRTVIGGGATGAGCALDAITRGLKTALVEADDFASGTSSRSTKLIHGGVRYLQTAILRVCYANNDGLVVRRKMKFGFYVRLT